MASSGDSLAPARRAALRGRKRAVGVSVALHLVALAAVLTLRTDPPHEPEPPVFAVLEPIPTAPTPPAPRRLARAPAAPLPLNAASAPSPAPSSPEPPLRARLAATRSAPETLAVSGTSTPDAEGAGDGVTEGEAAGAARAGGAGPGGASGGGCDMVGRLEAALRKDQRVRDAMSARNAGGRAVRVWNGDWTESPGQEGRGLAAVREAVLWEVGFAPEACRRQPMRGLVLLSLGDGPTAGRLVLGAADWRWTDMLTPRGLAGRGGQPK